MKNWMFNYWQRKNYIINYYMFHFALSALVEEDKKCKELWQNMPYVCNMNPDVYKRQGLLTVLLQGEIGVPYNVSSEKTNVHLRDFARFCAEAIGKIT